MNLSIVVPIYKGEAFIEPLVAELTRTLPTFAETYEIILVNDGSPDHSWQLIQRLTREHKWVRGIRMMRNYGQHNATLCGVREACHEVVVNMDQDLQHPPQEIPRLLQKLEEGYDVVYGSPRKLPQSLWRNAMTAGIKWILAKVIGLPSVHNVS